jgi:hypothetical protein
MLKANWKGLSGLPKRLKKVSRKVSFALNRLIKSILRVLVIPIPRIFFYT